MSAKVACHGGFPYNSIMPGQPQDAHRPAASPFEPDPVIEAFKKDVDRTLLRENLKLTVEQRLQQLLELQAFAQELHKAGKKAMSQE